MEGNKEKPYLTLFNFSIQYNIKFWHQYLFIALNILLNQNIYCVFDIYFLKKTNVMYETGQCKNKINLNNTSPEHFYEEV